MPIPARSTARWSLVVLSLVGCSPNTPADSSPTTFDLSSDVPVATLDGSAPTIWRFGGIKTSPDSELNTLTGIVQLAGGRILLTEADHIRLFDSVGTELWRYGQAGAGPEDFAMVGWPCRLQGDTIAAFDQRNNRFAFILPTVGVVATAPAERFTALEAACNGRGTMVIAQQVADSATGQSLTEIWVRGGPGSQAHLITTVPIATPGTIGAGRTTTGQVGPLIYVADPNAGTIALFGQDGQRVRLIESAGARVSVTDANIPERARRAPRELSPAQTDAWWNEVRARPRAEHWPAFGDVAPYDDSHLWIFEDRGPRGDSISTWVVGVDGTVVQKILLPSPTPGYRLGVMGILPSGIALVTSDSVGAVWVSVVERPR